MPPTPPVDTSSSPSGLRRLLALARVDFQPAARQPSVGAVVAATVVALGGSVLADAALVWIGTALFPSTKGFSHFRLGDYGTLTAIGVLVACAAWPVTTRITSAPRWLFVRLAVAVTLVLWLPDVDLLLRGEPPRAVAVLMVMHLAVALVTYQSLVRLASVGEAGPETLVRLAGAGETGPETLGVPPPESADRPAAAEPEAAGTSLADRRSPWVVLVSLVGVEFVLGVVALFAVPTGRATGWVPSRGAAVYLAHAVAGVVLATAAVTLTASARRSGRLTRICAILGVVGVGLGAAGGLLSVDHGLRLLGLGLMLVGSLVAATGYLMPAVGALSEPGAPDQPTAR